MPSVVVLGLGHSVIDGGMIVEYKNNIKMYIFSIILLQCLLKILSSKYMYMFPLVTYNHKYMYLHVFVPFFSRFIIFYSMFVILTIDSYA